MRRIPRPSAALVVEGRRETHYQRIRARWFPRTLALLTASAAVVASLAFASAGGAAVSPGFVNISMPTELGNCPRGGTVATIRVTTANSVSVSRWGEDTVLARVMIGGGPQLVTGVASCYIGTVVFNTVYTAPAVTAYINPTVNGQTFFLKPVI
jgi:hypothetical protein